MALSDQVSDATIIDADNGSVEEETQLEVTVPLTHNSRYNLKAGLGGIQSQALWSTLPLCKVVCIEKYFL